MTYQTTPRCDEDIIDIYVRGVIEFGVDQAETYNAGLLSTFELIARNPRLARLRAEFTPPVRMYPYRAHMIVYVANDEGVLVIRVLHGRQDWPRHLRSFSATSPRRKPAPR